MKLKALAASAYIMLAMASASQAATFKTTVSTTGAPLFDRLELIFSTQETSGIVDQNELSDFRMDLFLGTKLLISDSVIVNGMAKNIGGQARDLSSGIFFNFDIDAFLSGNTTNVVLYDNDVQVVQGGGRGVGPTANIYNFFGGRTQTDVDFFTDGGNFVSDSQGVDSFLTVELAPVPLPAGSLLLLTGLGGVAAFNRRKRRAA